MLKKKIVQRVYETPRISIKMLCEYVNASASRRSTIIKDSSVVPTYIAKRYNRASEVIANHLTNPKSSAESLRADVVSLIQKTYKSSYEREMAMLSVQAISSFAPHAESFKKILGGFKVEQSNHFNYHKLIIESVEISIRPELIIRSSINNDIIGFIKFYFSKSEQLDSESADLITCLGRNYFNETHELNLVDKNCLVLDVFRGELSMAPKSFKKRMSDISASCREIADRWARFIN